MSMHLTLKRTKKLVSAINTLDDKSNHKSLINFRRTVYGFKILIIVMNTFLDEDSREICTKEYLTKQSSTLASRATIINFINDQVSSGTLMASSSLIDGRIKIITPSNALLQDYDNWLEYISNL